MLLEKDLIVVSGYDKNETPPELNHFLGLLQALLSKIAGIQPRYLFLKGTGPKPAVQEIKPGNTVLFFLFPPLASSAQATFTLTGIMDVLMASKDQSDGQIILFSDRNQTHETLLVPEFLPGLKYHYNLSLVSGTGKQLPNQENVFDCLLDIAYGMRKNREKKNAPDDTRLQPSVFLAETTPDAEYFRSSLKNELEGMGYRIVAPGNLQDNVPSLKEKMENLISKCFLSLHLIGRTYGKDTPDGSQSLVQFQLDVAGQQAIGQLRGMAGPMKRMIWIMPHTRKSDPRQESLISQIKQESPLFAQSELLEIPFESFKTYLQKYLAGATWGETKTTEHIEAGRGLFVIYEHKASATVIPLLDWLQKEKIAFEVPRFEGSPEIIMEHYKGMMSACQSVWIVHANGNDIWLRTKINDVLKAPGYGRETPFHSCIILAASALNFTPADPFKVINSSFAQIDPDLEEKLISILHHV